MTDPADELLRELQAALLTGDMDVIVDVLVRVGEWSSSLPETEEVA